MKHTYNISGMSCSSCKSAVEKNLNSIERVTSVEVNLTEKEVDIIMNTPIELHELQNSLPNKYTLSIKEKNPIFTTEQVSSFEIKKEKTKFQQLKPLFIILCYITVASNIMHYKNWNITEVMLDFMGLFFIVFSFFKLLDLKGFTDSFRMYDPLAKRIPIYAWIYPFLETILGIQFLLRFEVDIALITTLIILSITTIGVTKTLIDKKTIRCACLGTALKLPMTEATFIENALMIIMAVLMLINIF